MRKSRTIRFQSRFATTEGVIRVRYSEFATIPDFNGTAPRIMTMIYEPGAKRSVCQ
jgi:hypothetical protein